MKDKYPVLTKVEVTYGAYDIHGNRWAGFDRKSFKTLKKQVEEWMDIYPMWAPIQIRKITTTSEAICSVGVIASTYYDDTYKDDFE